MHANHRAGTDPEHAQHIHRAMKLPVIGGFTQAEGVALGAFTTSGEQGTATTNLNLGIHGIILSDGARLPQPSRDRFQVYGWRAAFRRPAGPSFSVPGATNGNSRVTRGQVPRPAHTSHPPPPPTHVPPQGTRCKHPTTCRTVQETPGRPSAAVLVHACAVERLHRVYVESSCSHCVCGQCRGLCAHHVTAAAMCLIIGVTGLRGRGAVSVRHECMHACLQHQARAP